MSKFVLAFTLCLSFSYLMPLNIKYIHKVKNSDEFILDINHAIEFLIDIYLSTFACIEKSLKETDECQLDSLALSRILNNIKQLDSIFNDKYNLELKTFFRLSNCNTNYILELLLSLKFFYELNLCSLYEASLQRDFFKKNQSFIKRTKRKCFFLIVKNGYLDLLKKHKSLLEHKDDFQNLLKKQKKLMRSFLNLLEEESELVKTEFSELMSFELATVNEFVLSSQEFSKQKKQELIYSLFLFGLDNIKDYYKRSCQMHRIIKNEYNNFLDIQEEKEGLSQDSVSNLDSPDMCEIF